ncbi:serine hydrolase domain-containing protein [Eupransor demetentiae]|uniref:Beta-lactamase class C family (AmpC) n=1 Tax=Eupransor demetentiae TaxID=3109584 RepID=A0ABM9N618_9LACO|nr:CubicO group peptidase [Lactobacillaceae bacterium LMG 33000]
MQRVDKYPAVLKGKWFGEDKVRAVRLAGAIIIFAIIWPWATGPGELSQSSKINVRHDAKYYQALQQTVTAQTPLAKRVDRIIKDDNFQGTALVVHHGHIILQQGYGDANHQKKIKNQAQSVYQIASVQKAMTATLIAREVEKGKLSYDTKLSKFYPKVPHAKQITIRQLLTMTSGLRQKYQPKTFQSDWQNVEYSAEHADVVAKPGDGKEWSYQPVNYRLLAGILMQLNNESYSKLFQQVFNDQYHLKMLDYQQFHQSSLASLGYGDDYDGPRDVDKVEYQRETGTGNVGTSTGMLYRFFYLLFDKQLVSNPQAMWQTIQPETYAAGGYQYPDYKTGHGIFTGYESTVALSKDGSEAVILLSNQYYRGHTYEDLSHHLFHEVTGITIK